MKKVLFYSSVENIKLFQTQKFYFTDIVILQEIGFEVLLSNRIIDALFFWRYDFVFAYFYRKSLFVALIAKLFMKNTYFTGGIDDLDKKYSSSRRYLIQKWFMRLCYIFSKSCIIVSKSDLENVASIISSVNKINYSEHTIDVSKYICTSYEKENLFTTISWMGTKGNVKRKGLDLALKIFSHLKMTPKFSDYKFVIIGKKGFGTNYIESLISEYSISDSVIITDEISEDAKVDYLKKSKYYFQLSLYEGFGVAALEALSAQNIVIHSGKGGLSNPIFSNGITYNIDNEFSDEFNLLIEALESYDEEKLYSCLEYMKLYYANFRRKEDFKKIINE